MGIYPFKLLHQHKKHVATHTQRMSVTVSASGFDPEGNGSTPLCAALRCNYAKNRLFSNLIDEIGGNFEKSAAFFIQTCPPGR